MTPLRAVIAVLLFATIFVGSNMWVRAAAHRNVVVIASPIGDSTAVVDGSIPALHVRGDDDWVEPRTDLNGNEVDAAVGDYRLDRRGDMYERHAPDTALLHLDAPRM